MDLTFKEKRLIFQDAPAKAPDAAPAPAPNAAPPAASETPEAKKAAIEARISALQNKITKVTQAANKEAVYTKKLLDAATEIDAKLKEIDTQLKALDLSATDAAATLQGFDDGLKAAEAADFEDATLKTDIELKAKIEATRGTLKASADAITPDALRTKIMEAIGVTNSDLKAAIEEFLPLDIFKTNEVDKDVEAIAALLNDADNAATVADAQAKITEAEGKIVEITIDKYLERPMLKDFITETKSWIDVVNALKALCKDGKFCLAASGEIEKEVAKMIKDPSVKVTPDLIHEEFEEDIALSHVADVIGLAAESAEKAVEQIKGALRYYELGEYKKYYPNKEAEELLTKILDAKPPGLQIDYLGGTDGTDHRLMKDKDWHKAKADAFEKLLAFNTAGKLSGLTLSPEQIDMITRYITEARADKGYEFVKDPTRKDLFIKGGGLFDAALALQRAEDMKQKIEGEDSAWKVDQLAAGADTLYIETGTTKNKKEERKSGLKFSVIVAEEGNNGVPYEADADEAAAADEAAGEAAADAPPEDPNKADIDRATFLGILFKTKEQAKADGDITADDEPKAGFYYVDPVSDSNNYAVAQNDTSPLAGDKFEQILPANLKGKGFSIISGGDINRNNSGNQRYKLYKDGHLKTTNADNQTLILAPGKDPDVATNWEVEQEAPKEQTNENDHAYAIEDDGRLRVIFKGEGEPTYYTIVKPDNVTLYPNSTDNDNDQFVTFGIGEDAAWIDFADDKNFFPGHLDSPGNTNTYTATLENNTITITATPKPTAATGDTAPAEGAAAAPDPLKLLHEADEAATLELKAAILAADSAINTKITELETAVLANEGWKAGTVQGIIDEKRVMMASTLINARTELDKAKSWTAAGNYQKALDTYTALATSLDDTLKQELEADARESLLEDATKEKITALRQEVTTQKDAVAAAFAKKKAALEALDAAAVE